MPEDPKAFIARAREKYPMYKDIDDDTLLSAIYRKFPAYTDVATAAFGGITKGKPNAMREFSQQVDTPENKYAELLVPETALGRAGRTLRKASFSAVAGAEALDNAVRPIDEKAKEILLEGPVGATRAIAAGHSPIEGFIEPRKQPTFGESAVNALTAAGLGEADRDGILGGTIGTMLDVAANMLVFHYAPKAVKELPTDVTKLYTGVQGKALDKLRDKMINVMTKAGVPEAEATSASSSIIANRWANESAMAKTPWRINQTTAQIEKNEGALANMFKEELLTRKNTGAPSTATPTSAAPANGQLALASRPTHPLLSGEINGVHYELPDGRLARLVKGKLEPIEDLIIQVRDNSKIEKSLSPIDPTEDLAVAIKGKDGKISHAPFGGEGMHWQLAEKLGFNNVADEGWVNKAGKWLTREEAEGIIEKRMGLRQEKLEVKKDRLSLIKQLVEARGGKFGDIPIVPDFKSTNDAVAYGESIKNKPNLIGALKDARAALAAPIQAAYKNQEFQIGMDLSTKAQFYKEAFEAAEAIKNPAEKLQQLNQETLETVYTRFPKDAKIQSEIGKEATTRLQTDPTIDNLDSLQTQLEQASSTNRAYSNELKKQIAKERKKKDESGRAFSDVVFLRDKIRQASNDLKEKTFTLTKQLGQPAMVAQKYPKTFGPVYKAVRNPQNKSSEIYYNLRSNIDDNLAITVLRDTKTSEKLASVFMLEDTKNIRIPELDLSSKYGLNEGAVTLYKQIRALHDAELPIEVETRKALYNYDSMKPDQIAKFDTKIKEYLTTRKGYVNTKRFSGDWIVFRGEGLQTTEYFATRETETEAKALAQKIGGEFFKKDNFRYEATEKMSLESINSLLDEVDLPLEEIEKIKNAFIGKGLAAKWVHKRGVEGFDYTLENIIKGARLSAESTARRWARTVGHKNAEKTFFDLQDSMTPAERIYTKNFIKNFYNSSYTGYRGLMQVMYTSELAFAPKYLALDLISPYINTYPLLGKYYQGLEPEAVFLKTYKNAVDYFLTKDKSKSTLQPQLKTILTSLSRQRLLGGALTEFVLDGDNLASMPIDSAITFFARIGEQLKREHAAIVGYDIATTKYKLTDTAAIQDFIVNFLEEANPTFGSHNIPVGIGNLGVASKAARTAYTFRGFSLFFLQQAARRMSGNNAERIRFLIALMTASGIYGGFKGLVDYGFKKATGHTSEDLLRRTMTDANIPGVAQDIATQGVGGAFGIDLSSSVGLDIIIDPEKDLLTNIVGVPGNFANNLAKSIYLASMGRWEEAGKYTPIGVIRRYFRGKEIWEKGPTSISGEKLGESNKKAAILTAIGLPSSEINKIYSERDALYTIRKTHKDKASKYAEEAARALFINNNPRQYEKVYKKALDDGIKINTESVRNFGKKFAGIKGKEPKATRLEVFKSQEAFKKKG